jgi:ABC-type transport system involved in multi-copper enzyme maturation permease subunit
LTRPLLYDFKRTLRSKSVIVAMLLPILISLAIVPLSLGVTTVSGPPSSQALMYYDSNGYHFLAFSSDQYGLGAAGVTYQFNLTNAQGNYAGTGTTNSSGLAFITVKAPIGQTYNGLLTVTSSGSSLSGQFSTEVSLPNGTLVQPSEGQIVPISVGAPIPFWTVQDQNNATKRDLLVFYAGPFGARPQSYSIYYKVYNESSFQTSNSATGQGNTSIIFRQPPAYFNESEMILLGTLNDYKQIYPVTLPSNDTCSNVVTSNGGGGALEAGFPCSGDLLIYFELFSQNGTLLQTQQFSPDQFFTPPVVVQSVNIASSFFATIMGIFIPLIAIIGAYSSYGKDRVSGVLESVLSRPVTRMGLATSRFLSTFLALGVAIGISVGAIDGMLKYFGGQFLSATFLLASAGAFLVELAAFIGLIFLFSHLVRSSALLIGIAIGLFIIFDFLWGVIVLLVSVAVRLNPGSLAYLKASTIAQFFNPAQYIQLVILYLTNTSQSFGFQVPPSVLGVTVASIVVAGLLWIALPFAAFLYLAIKRD